MKALIFNSGLGRRMGKLTENKPKCLLKLNPKESIFERQLRILRACGIKEIIVTTGEYEEALKDVTGRFKDLMISFIHNPEAATTNYIYSMYLARETLKGDLLLLHGDLVFNQGLVEEMLKNPEPSMCLVNKKINKPLKDFKGRLENDLLREVSIHIFEEDCYALQPLYKLSDEIVKSWLKEVEKFIACGSKNVYAEEALNPILKELRIKAMSYEAHYINEIDTLQDFEKVKQDIEQFDSK